MWELVYLEPFVYEFILFIVELRLPFLFFSIPPDGHVQVVYRIGAGSGAPLLGVDE